MRTQPIAHGVFYANNRLMLKRIIDAGGDGGRKWEEVKVDLSEFAGHTVTLRLYQQPCVCISACLCRTDSRHRVLEGY
ncbi:MAG: hypothetical protein DME18_16640 [Verrucomicrobia bacterium]|nr:MAG: hypothetical protein DME18_16640 [Verrucomicrobiota bacterium]